MSRTGAPRLMVLASGSAGNCSVLEIPQGGSSIAILIDLGLSPRRTRRHLEEAGIRPDQIRGALLTHPDRDHLHAGWAAGMPAGAEVFLHAGHLEESVQRGVPRAQARTFSGSFEAFGCRIRPVLLEHDQEGVVSYRIDWVSGGEAPASLGFVTDAGRTTSELIDELREVDVLAIESNYCPRMQERSSRPDYLKRRIMGGAGHLSNQEAADAVLRISPSHHVVFLHLSRECNDPERVREIHESADYEWTISQQHLPTRWVDIRRGRASSAPAPAEGATRLSLFG